MAGLVPAIHDLLACCRRAKASGNDGGAPTRLHLSVIAELDPAIHAVRLPLEPAGDLTRRPLQPPWFFGTVMAWISDQGRSAARPG
jgi:hypothetical protein